jgi:ketosteroid isomerase-like protein
MRVLVSVLVGVIVCLFGTPLLAQSAEQEIRTVNQSILAAAGKADKAAYAPLMADDLRWVGADGVVLAKDQRLAQLVAPSSAGRIFRDEDIKVYGDIAVVVLRSDWKVDGKPMSERVLRVFAKRSGRWQLLNHAAVVMPVTTK